MMCRILAGGWGILLVTGFVVICESEREEEGVYFSWCLTSVLVLVVSWYSVVDTGGKMEMMTVNFVKIIQILFLLSSLVRLYELCFVLPITWYIYLTKEATVMMFEMRVKRGSITWRLSYSWSVLLLVLPRKRYRKHLEDYQSLKASSVPSENSNLILVKSISV